MPTHYTIHKDQGYVLLKFVGEFNDNTLFADYQKFIDSESWIPGLNELIDLSEADFSAITSTGMIRLGRYTEEMLLKHEIDYIRTAIYAPDNLPFGMSRVYSAHADDSPEHTRVFRDFEKAKNWLQAAD